MALDSLVTRDPLVDEVAGALQASVRLLVQRLRQSPAVEGDLTSAETSAMARLDRMGQASPSELARLERISPQSMGATVAGLEERGLVGRAPDPSDGRRALLSLTQKGEALLQRRRSARSESLSVALSSGFSRSELKRLLAAAPLIERLAQSI
jgi:DNA-binding MarR family transcriptional regulator